MNEIKKIEKLTVGYGCSSVRKEWQRKNKNIGTAPIKKKKFIDTAG